MNISVFGLGYVGAVSMGCLVRDGHCVVGVDIDAAKLNVIRAGSTPVIEAGMDELMADAAASGRMQVTDDASDALQRTDVSFICVGTPSLRNGKQDLSAITRLTEQLGAALRDKTGYHVFVVRSTVTPGTVENVIHPILQKHSGKRVGKDFGLCFQPEFLREGSSIKDYYNPPYTVVGGDSERSVEVVRSIFRRLPCEFICTSIRAAEMLKYCCNAFHALKATFANEIGRISQSLDVDPHQVMDLVCRDTRLNISRAYMRPGFAFGGSCLPKDLRALMHLAKSNDVEVPVLSKILPSNQIHIEHAIRTILARGRKSLGMIGLTFKSGTDDLRESPLVLLAERFIGKGLDLRIYDPEVNIARLVGTNRSYIEETIPHISSLMQDTLEEVIDRSDTVIVGLNGDAIMKKLYARVRQDQFVLDLVGVPERERLAGIYRGICW